MSDSQRIRQHSRGWMQLIFPNAQLYSHSESHAPTADDLLNLSSLTSHSSSRSFIFSSHLGFRIILATRLVELHVFLRTRSGPPRVREPQEPPRSAPRQDQRRGRGTVLRRYRRRERSRALSNRSAELTALARQSASTVEGDYPYGQDDSPPLSPHEAQSIFSHDIWLGDNSGESQAFARNVEIAGWTSVGDRQGGAYVGECPGDRPPPPPGPPTMGWEACCEKSGQIRLLREPKLFQTK